MKARSEPLIYSGPPVAGRSPADAPAPRFRRERAFRAAAVILGLLGALLLTIGFLVAYVAYCRSTHTDVDLRLRRHAFVQRWLIDDDYRHLMAVLGEMGDDWFRTRWDIDASVALSRQLFVPTDMDGAPSYRYKPELRGLDFTVWSGMDHRSFVVKSRPAILKALERCEVIRRIEFETDANGFRTTGLPFDPGRPSVVFLGDSFTEGLHVASQDGFVAVFGRTMAAAGIEGNVVNMGLNGYSPAEEAWTLETFGERVQAKVVVVNLFPNDVHGNFHEVLRDQVPDASYVAMLALLDRMKGACARLGATLVVAVIPPWEQLVWNDARDTFQGKVEEWCRKGGVAFIDPRPLFQEAGVKTMYLGWDGHLSEDGHERYGHYLFEQLDSVLRGLVPSEPREGKPAPASSGRPSPLHRIGQSHD